MEHAGEGLREDGRVGLATISQKAFSLSSRSFGPLPAMRAAFTAPIEIPAIQLQRTPARCMPS